jgi:lipoprotein-releasing system permease protein
MFFLSWRQLVARKKQSLLILLGISFGTMLYVSISGIQLGMRQYISNQLLNNTAHIRIKGAEKRVDPEKVRRVFYGNSLSKIKWVSPPAGLREEVKLENYARWFTTLRNDSRVMDFSPRLAAHVVLSRGKFTTAVSLIGTIPERQVKISAIEKYMKEGSFLSLKGSNNIIVGSGVADDLGLKTGQYVLVSPGPGIHRFFKVAGISHFGNEQVDRALSFGLLSDIQILTKKTGQVTEIAVALNDIDEAKKVASEWRLLTHDKVEDWQEANASFMEMIRVQDLVRYFITTAILVVASFGIYNVLTIMINQKKREIAILRAIGYGPAKIRALVLYQGLLLGLFGGILGLALGFLVCLYIGNVSLNIEIGGSNHLLISYDWDIYFIAFVAAMVSAFIAAWIPARAAGKMAPMEIIRSE